MWIDGWIRAAVVGAVAVSGLLVAGAPAAATGRSSVSPLVSAEATRGDTTELSDEVVQALLKLRDEGPALLPETYGDIASGVPGDVDVLVVYLTERTSEIEQEIIALTDLPAAKVVFKSAAMTQLEARAVDERFNADVPDLINEGYDLQSWGIGEGVDYHVQILESEPAGRDDRAFARQRLANRYGPHLRVDFVADEAALAASRVDDAPEWHGGDFLNANRSGGSGTSFQSCSSGFPVKWNTTGNMYLLTAGHCYTTAERVYNGIGNVAGGWRTRLVGSVTNRSWSIGYPDAELIAADGSRAMWSGPTTESTRVAVVDVFVNPWRGMPLCVDGAYEGEYCGMTVGDPDHGVTAGGNSMPHQATLSSTNVQAVGAGDSGGPAYATIHGTTYGVGIISSVVDGYYPCTNWSSQIGGRLCGSQVNIQNIGPILSMWNLSIDL